MRTLENRSSDFQIDGSRVLFRVVQWDRYHMKAVCLYFLVLQTFQVVFTTKHCAFSKTWLTLLSKFTDISDFRDQFSTHIAPKMYQCICISFNEQSQRTPNLKWIRAFFRYCAPYNHSNSQNLGLAPLTMKVLWLWGSGWTLAGSGLCGKTCN